MKLVNQNQGHFLGAKALLAALGLVFASAAFASPTSSTYHYYPADALKNNIQTALTEQQIDISGLEIVTDEQGAVSVEGEVASKQVAETIAKVIDQKEGVYSAFTRLVYPQP